MRITKFNPAFGVNIDGTDLSGEWIVDEGSWRDESRKRFEKWCGDVIQIDPRRADGAVRNALHQRFMGNAENRYAEDLGSVNQDFEHKWNAITPLLTKGGLCKVAIYNGVGTGLGDLVCGSVGIRAIYDRIKRDGYEPDITLVCKADRAPLYRELFKFDPHVARVCPIGLVSETFFSMNFVATSELMVADPVFTSNTLVGYYCSRFGVGLPEDVKPRVYFSKEAEESGRDIVKELWKRGDGRRVVALNPHASGPRRLPMPLWKPLIHELIGSGWSVGVISGPLEATRHKAMMQILREEGLHDHLYDATEWCGPGFDRLCGFLNAVDGVVTTDTGPMHVAGALDTPTVAVMYNIDPDLRVREYNTIRAYCPKAFREGKYWNQTHIGERPAMYESDLDWCRPWKKISTRAIVKLLDEAQRGIYA